jgi:hypothetical protein
MSVRVMTQVWALDLPDSEKIVLLALADCANDEGGCWPSMRTLTVKCSKTDRTIQTAIKSLVDKGHLSREEIVGKGCRYLVHPDEDAKLTPEVASPRSGFPPKGTTLTPEAASDKPSRTLTNTKRATRLPDDFVVPLDWIEWAIAKRGWSGADARDEAENFRGYWQARAGKEATKLDWEKTWQNWVRNSRRKAGAVATGPPSQPADFASHLAAKYRNAA